MTIADSVNTKGKDNNLPLPSDLRMDQNSKQMLDRKIIADGHLTIGPSRYEGPFPFSSNTKVGTLEIIKIILMMLTGIVLFRVLFLIVILFLIWLFSKIGNYCCKSFFKCIVRCLLRGVLFCLGFYWISITNLRKKGPRKANILVANHISLADALKIIIDTGASFAAKSDLIHNPVVGPTCKLFDMIPIERGSSEGRKKALQAITNRSKDLNAPPLLIFPEGTTSIPSMMTMFKVGAFSPGQSVQPICIEYPHYNYDMYLGGNAGFELFRTLCQVYNCVHYTYMEEYIPTSEETSDAKLFANNVRNVMQKQLHIKITEHSFVDALLRDYAQKYGVKVDIVLQDIKERFNMKLDKVKELLRQFKKLDKDQDGHINFEEFCKIIKFNPIGDYAENAQRLYTLLDTDGDGILNFGDFVAAIAIFSSDIEISSRACALFNICDLNNDGVVTREEFLHILNYSQEQSSWHRKYQLVDQDLSLLLQEQNSISKFDFMKRIEVNPELASNILNRLLSKHIQSDNESKHRKKSSVWRVFFSPMFWVVPILFLAFYLKVTGGQFFPHSMV